MVKFYASFATMRKAHSCFPPHILAHVTKYRLPTHACIAATTKDEQVRQIENVKQFRSLKNLQGRTKHTHPWPAVFGKLLCLLMRRKKSPAGPPPPTAPRRTRPRTPRRPRGVYSSSRHLLPFVSPFSVHREMNPERLLPT